MPPAPDPQDLLAPVEVFFGDASHASARIYARLAGGASLAGCRLSGRVTGPECAYAHTLSAAVPLAGKEPPRELGPAAALLAEAIVPDPCFWSPDMPFLYRVEAELRRGDEVLAAADRWLGIRPLGARDRRLFFQARPWVARGVRRDEVPNATLSAWRASAAAMYVADPLDELCQEASRVGVMLLAGLSAGTADPAAAVRRLGRWPSVAMAVLESGAPLPATIRLLAPNLLLAQHVGPGAALAPAAWAHVVVCEDGDAAMLARRAAHCPLPVIAQRNAGRQTDLADARAHCDRLQRDLAGRGDFAGYLV